MTLPTVSLLDVPITNASKEDILLAITEFLSRKKDKGYIVTPNPEILVFGSSHPAFRTILSHAFLSLPDGIGVIKAGELLGTPIRERITGTDFMVDLVKLSQERSFRIGLIGGKGGVARKTAQYFETRFPNVSITALGEDLTEKEIFRIGEQKPFDLLFVAYGFPKQEEWIARYLPYMRVRLAMTVGGAFDYYANAVPRAPLWLRKAGLEWIYRLIRQPWRITRQWRLLVFILLVIKEKYLVAKHV